jgi:hypothetical protein
MGHKRVGNKDRQGCGGLAIRKALDPKRIMNPRVLF